MPADGGPIQPVPGGVRLLLVIQPRASKSEVVGLHGDRLKLRLAAPPVEGAANLALIDFLARELGVSRSAVHLTAGASARRKTVVVDGVSVSRTLGILHRAPASLPRRRIPD